MNCGYVMELRDIEYFAVIAEHGQLGRAAEALHLSQPALSKSLRRLEDALGVKLFRRAPRGMELTPEGSLLLLRVRELRVSLGSVAREIADVSQGRAGHIRVGMGPALPTKFMAAAFAEFMKAAPRTSIQTIVSDADEITPALRDGRLDVVVNLLHPRPPEGLVYAPLYDDEYVVCGSVRHRLSRQRDVSLDDLSEERWILSGPVLPTQQRLQQVFQHGGLAPPRIAFETRSPALRLQTAASSDLLLYISRHVIDEAVAAGAALRVIPVKELVWLRPVGVIRRKESYVPPAVGVLMKILETASRRMKVPGR